MLKLKHFFETSKLKYFGNLKFCIVIIILTALIAINAIFYHKELNNNIGTTWGDAYTKGVNAIDNHLHNKSDNSPIETEEYQNTEHNESAIHHRTKRFGPPFMGLEFMTCWNFPLCCDVRRKDAKGRDADSCGFACPVCPIKRDYCK